MRRAVGTVLVLVLSACAEPRTASPAPADSPRTDAAAGATAASASSAPASDPLLQELAVLQSEFKDADSAFWDSLPKGEDGTLQLSDEDSARMPSRAFVPRFQDLAERARGTAAEVEALLALLDIASRSWWNGKDPGVEAGAMRSLLERHADSPRMGKAIAQLRYFDHVIGPAEVEAGLARLAESPHADVRAVALRSQAERLVDFGGPDAAAREILERLQREHPGSGPARDAEGLLFKLDHLRVGLVAPDQEAVDQDGATFRLSDYRGKVVLLVFWGFW